MHGDSAHGSGVGQAPVSERNTHCTIICGHDLLAVDCAAAGKINADYAQSPLLKGMIEVCVPPESCLIFGGPRRKFSDFKLPRAPQLSCVLSGPGSVALLRTAAGAVLQQIETDLFPLKASPRCENTHPRRNTIAHLDEIRSLLVP